jgi:hypothetical protein
VNSASFHFRILRALFIVLLVLFVILFLARFVAPSLWVDLSFLATCAALGVVGWLVRRCGKRVAQ